MFGNFKEIMEEEQDVQDIALEIEEQVSELNKTGSYVMGASQSGEAVNGDEVNDRIERVEPADWVNFYKI